jgi:hypothetical protein
MWFSRGWPLFGAGGPIDEAKINPVKLGLGGGDRRPSLSLWGWSVWIAD